MKWSTRQAAQAQAHDRAVSDAGGCPNCGSPADVTMIDVSTPAESAWVPGEVRCSAMCWMRDPDAYLAAVSA